MPRMDKCLITVKTALQISKGLPVTGYPFLCPECKKPVQPLSEGGTKSPYFKHLKRNLDCPLSDKTKAKALYKEYRAGKRAKGL
jgi:hypothetical protein